MNPGQQIASANVHLKSARWKCVCAYDGREFAGWQSQPGGTGVQDKIESRLAVLLGHSVRIHGSGRTDAGVHADNQVFHFDAAWRHGGERLVAALNAGLPSSILIRSATQVSLHFHARFSVAEKVYRYQLYLGTPDPFLRPFVWARADSLDLEKMRSVARALEGKHDFRAFSANSGVDRLHTVRDLHRLRISRRGRLVRIEAAADGFLYKMVRSLVGALVAAGEKKMTPDEVMHLLEAAKPRTHEVPTAPAHGLFLHRVRYRRTISGDSSHEDSEVVGLE